MTTKAVNSFYNKLPPALKNMEAPPPMWFELDRLYKEVERLQAALKPFADANLDRVTLNDDRTASSLGVTLGDFRNAHDILYPPSVT